MMALQYWSERLGSSQPQVLRLRWSITGAAAASAQELALPVLASFGAITDAAIYGFLHKSNGELATASEHTAAAFDATAMGADVFGGVVDMYGQCKKLLNMVAVCYSGTGGATKVEQSVAASTAMTASTLATECANGTNGNPAFRAVFGNTPDFDGLSAGQIHIDLEYLPK
jgi:hypothetical protein